jgi:rhamnulokinase
MASWIGFAADLGASNGRTILGSYDGRKLSLRELTRFPNTPVELGGTIYWDFPRLFGEVQNGLIKAVAEGHSPSTLGIDTWGVDFGLIDQYGDLISNPRHYRNNVFGDVFKDVHAMIPEQELYAKTGNHLLQINTVYQLMYLRLHRPELLERSRRMVLFPDLMNYFLTGELASEFTHASTTELYNPTTGGWAFDLIERLGVNAELFLPIVQPLSILGNVRDSVLAGSSQNRIKVVNIGEHDTASAVLAVPYETDDYAYISSGTWSLVGVVTDRPVISDLARHYNFTNEGGVGGRFRFLKNVMGLWLLQEVRRQLVRYGDNYHFADLTDLAVKEKPLQALVDPDRNEFLAPDNMITAIQTYCRQARQPVPENPGQLARTIMESLALRYRWVIERLEELQHKSLSVIHIVGGGALNKVLCQWTADAANRPVVAGPAEATVMGNLAAQLIVSGELSGIEEIPQLINHSFEKTVYFPSAERAQWDIAYGRFLDLIKQD